MRTTYTTQVVYGQVFFFCDRCHQWVHIYRMNCSGYATRVCKTWKCFFVFLTYFWLFLFSFFCQLTFQLFGLLRFCCSYYFFVVCFFAEYFTLYMGFCLWSSTVLYSRGRTKVVHFVFFFLFVAGVQAIIVGSKATQHKENGGRGGKSKEDNLCLLCIGWCVLNQVPLLVCQVHAHDVVLRCFFLLNFNKKNVARECHTI